jgi:glycosyltransferase involved in cell wall biosynthesis
MTPGSKDIGSRKTRIIWLNFIPAAYLNTMADLEILRALARKNDVYLIGSSFSIKYRLRDSNIHVSAIPIDNERKIPLLKGTHLASNIILLLFMPIYVAIVKPDFIITKTDGTIFGLLSTLLLKRCLGSRGFRIVLDIRSTPVETFKSPFRFTFTICMAKKMFEGITIITTLMRKEICARFGIDPNFVGVWSVGASPTLFKLEKHVNEGKMLRKQLELSDKFVVLYHGAFSSHRGLIEAIDAFAMIMDAYPHLVLFLLGKGRSTNDLRELVHEKNLERNVIVHDAVDYTEVPKYIAMCDIGIVPLPNLSYWRYQCPLKLLEYLAMQKVAILTDIPAHREIVGTQKCGIYISSIDPAEIASAVVYAYENKRNLEEWGKSGRQIVSTRYNWEKAAEDLEKYLISLEN